MSRENDLTNFQNEAATMMRISRLDELMTTKNQNINDVTGQHLRQPRMPRVAYKPFKPDTNA